MTLGNSCFYLYLVILSSFLFPRFVIDTFKSCLRTRKSSRRRSTNRKSEPRESKDHYPDTVDLKIPACPPVIESLNEDNPVQERTSAPLKYGQKDQTASSQSQGQELRRTLVGRPMRRAAEKVCSYKEVPINVKMRRAE